MSSKVLKSISPKEEEIMTYFWQNGPLFVKDIVDMMDDPKPHINTVSTFVRSLESKGWLGHEQFGTSYKYFALVPMENYREKSLKGFVDRFFGKSYLGFVSSLVKDEKISTEELKQLIEKVESQKSNQK
jgi:transcriptional regulator, blaI/mecI/copY family